jgi:Tfp pilus assembly protein PilF
MLAEALLGILLMPPVSGAGLPDMNPLELNAEMQQFVDARISRSQLPMQRLTGLVSAVLNHDGLGFTYSPVSRTAVETFHARDGNCLSFAFLFISMARYLDLDVRFREVDIPPVFFKKGESVILGLHVNAVAFVDGRAYSIDVFPDTVPIDVPGRIVPDQRGFAYYFNNKGVSELSGGHVELAEKYFRKALEIDSDTAPVWINLGTACAKTGKFGEAETSYRKALRLDRNSMAAMNNLAEIYQLTGRTRESVKLLEKVRKFREKNPYYHFNLGFEAYEQSDYTAALVHFRRAIKLKSTEPNFYFAVARVYMKTGRIDQAEAEMRLAEKYASDPDKKLLYAQKLEALKAAQENRPD